eukprot:jgi/Botrbrau1/14494/Bobra.0350s0001.1
MPTSSATWFVLTEQCEIRICCLFVIFKSVYVLSLRVSMYSLRVSAGAQTVSKAFHA